MFSPCWAERGAIKVLAPSGATISYGPSREPTAKDTLAEIIGRSLPCLETLRR
jgi:hypothetical protein